MIRILIADDHAIVLTRLRQVLSEQPGLLVAGEAADGLAALDLVRHLELAVVLLDLAMPGHGGVDALGAIQDRQPDLPVLILSGVAESHDATTLLRQGAAGYLIAVLAEGLHLGVKTLFTHRTRVMKRLQLASNNDLTYDALKNGLID